ncbi:uncharacterized protein KY384_006737 [Bacidia gigantensis]|uniref:uncharacterized protein n=1 Tax=Bacidia gigantensis TaxID=2732470 RepID=UPI001D04B710|nr:uncharacterized protein KY384_006737 [Bacidia gigantensis]KAG8528565.1 hypothetical protein KY384_006737 [Bacidia gigantensis]
MPLINKASKRKRTDSHLAPEATPETSTASMQEHIAIIVDEEGDSEDVHSEDLDYPWCKDVRVTATTKDAVQVGHCKGYLIDRARIRHHFYEEMDGPDHDVKEFGVYMFDRFGNLKLDFYQHPVKRGTGAWGEEINKGRILLITSVFVKKEFRGQGHGKTMVQELWNKARATSKECMFAATMPAISRAPHLPMPTPQETARGEALLSLAEEFWRAVGFRRIGSSPYYGFAQDEAHPSKSLKVAADYRRPLALQGPKYHGNQEWPYTREMTTAKDDHLLGILRDRLQEVPGDHPIWVAKDNHGNNIMHIAAHRRPRSLAFLFDLDQAHHLETARNLEGETPLEFALARVEKTRLCKEYMDMAMEASNDFDGLTYAEHECVLKLMHITNPRQHLSEQIRFGCTCAECIEGFISPRMAEALRTQAALIFDLLRSESGADIEDEGDRWLRLNDHFLRYIPSPLHARLRTSYTLRQGYTHAFLFIRDLLGEKRFPSFHEVAERAEKQTSQHTKMFLQQGGGVASVIFTCIDKAVEEDEYLGDGSYYDCFGDTVDALKPCRNDHEFGFVRRQYCKHERITDGADIELGRFVHNDFEDF